MNARKQAFQGADALTLLENVNKLHVAKGKRVTVVDLKKERPTDDELIKLMVGPTGNLRAPTLRIGKNLIVGFHQGIYDGLLG